MASTLGFTPLPLTFFSVVVLFVIAYLAAADVAKLFFFREARPAPRALQRARSHRIHRIASRWSHHEQLPTHS
ncbi:MAG: hypothetical protein ACXWW9_05335 [Actinomycetota bacterium]